MHPDKLKLLYLHASQHLFILQLSQPQCVHTELLIINTTIIRTFFKPRRSSMLLEINTNSPLDDKTIRKPFIACKWEEFMKEWHINQSKNYSTCLLDLASKLVCRVQSCNIYFSMLKILINTNIRTMYTAGVSISTDGRHNASATLLREVGYFSLQRRNN